jgi:hypothetical protein
MSQMAISETRSIVIENDRGGDADGTLYVRKFSVMDRVLRALVMLGAIWLLAVISVLIPVAHFVLVPLLLLAGPVLALMRFRITEVNERVTGPCPTCGGDMAIPLDSSVRLPLWTYCPPAGHPIHLLDAAAGRRIGGGK